MFEMISGGTAALSLVAAMFFLKFWRRTHDRFFLIFAVAFTMMAVERFMLRLISGSVEYTPAVYLVRLAAFLVILGAIIDKNRKRPRNEPSA